MHEKISLFMVPFILSVSSSLTWQDDEVRDDVEWKNRSPLIFLFLSLFQPSSIWTLELIPKSFGERKQYDEIWGEEVMEREADGCDQNDSWGICMSLSYLVITSFFFLFLFFRHLFILFYWGNWGHRYQFCTPWNLFALFMRKLILGQ